MKILLQIFEEREYDFSEEIHNLKRKIEGRSVR